MQFAHFLLALSGLTSLNQGIPLQAHKVSCHYFVQIIIPLIPSSPFVIASNRIDNFRLRIKFSLMLTMNLYKDLYALNLES
jgi:hypothetical protein